MWLLRTDLALEGHLELVEFIGSDIPQYAILSHTWGKEEVSFADLKQPTNAIAKKGYEKIKLTLIEAAKAGLDYAWVDTCCINKDSSAELSEAINAMYNWYESASACYAYIQDVEADGGDDWRDQFRRSRWFTRGWTLQELLAPRSVLFFDRHWSPLGDKSDLSADVQTASSIPASYLNGRLPLNTASIAKRMSWAARRVTTRVEDMAYCLLGIFDVNLPMLYGEGSKAFIRLQEEIMRSTDDQSLFAWAIRGATADYSSSSGLLAPSPAAFAPTGNVVPSTSPDFVKRAETPADGRISQPLGTHVMTNRGLNIALHVRTALDQLHILYSTPKQSFENHEFLAMLDCLTEGNDQQYLAIVLVRTNESPEHFRRSRIHEVLRLKQPLASRRSIFVRQTGVGIKSAVRPFHFLRFGGWGRQEQQAPHTQLIDPYLKGVRSPLETQALFVDYSGRQSLWEQEGGKTETIIAIAKGSRLLSACMVIRPFKSTSFLLLIGSGDSWNLAFDVCQEETPLRGSGEPVHDWGHIANHMQIYHALPRSLSKVFKPKAPGTIMEVNDLVVTVHVRPLTYSSEEGEKVQSFTVAIRREQKRRGLTAWVSGDSSRT